MNKEEFKARASQTIDEVSAKINELKANKESFKEDAKQTYNETLKDLESIKADLKTKYANLENASEDKWDELKKSVASATESMKKTLYTESN